MPSLQLGLRVLIRKYAVPVLFGPPVLAFLPAATLGAYWAGGEAALVFTSLGVPLVLAILGSLAFWPPRQWELAGVNAAPTGRDGVVHQLEKVAETCRAQGLKSNCMVVELDRFSDLVTSLGQGGADIVRARVLEQIRSVLRYMDSVVPIGDARFAIVTQPTQQLDLELCLQMSGRLQKAVEEGVSVDGLVAYLSCSIGFCLHSRMPSDSAADWLNAAEAALVEAQSAGPSGIRAYSSHTVLPGLPRGQLADRAAIALEQGEIEAWYQPQISTDTGRITGFEALVRWRHPALGVLTPEAILPAMVEAGQMVPMGRAMLGHALTALCSWDKAGVRVPRVGLNFSMLELRDPELVSHICWELDRFDLTPDRLTVEVLETVVSDSPEDIIVRNISELGRLGCNIDLDDFGTGHASMTAIRRFDIDRIKIDRSFVKKSDCDPEQQKIVAAILTMAERLELETLAEGVETVGEHSLLAQLGCGHVQGYGIGLPMPFDKTLDWIHAHEAKLDRTPRIGGASG